MKKHEQCPFCAEAAYYHQTKPLKLRYKNRPITINQPGYWCDKCGEGVIDGNDRKATQKELQTFKANVDGLLTPDEIKRIRLKLHINQKEAGELFGGGVNAFSRYERGETPISKPVSQLLSLLDQHPELLSELESNHKIAAS